ncbi:PA14 domain-containing protein [Nocardioides sp. SYSU DS0663]|uniref:PA14 domain-containing protein n=1 Tax=Nocardioides sp. SYSU DS0663 TaxID=3416445 RepID=UPI003F4C5CD9
MTEHMRDGRGRARGMARTLAGALAITVGALTGVGVAVVPAYADQAVVVSPQPDQSHPRVMNGRVYAIDTHGPLVAVGGSFTQVREGTPGSPDQARQWLFLYDSDTGRIVQSFDPRLLGPTPVTTGLVPDQPGVEAVQFAPDGQSLYVAGWFTSVNGEPRQRVARLRLDGSVMPSFTATLNGRVQDMALVGDRLVIGGKFGRVNGQPVQRLASLDPETGRTQTDFNLPATESRDEYASHVQELEASPDGRWLVVSGSFQRIGAEARNQLALISLEGRPSVANWATDAYASDCSSVTDDTYIHGLAFDPDSSYFVVSTTGAYIAYDNMCDTATRWELPPKTQGENVPWTWRAQTGGDTLWATAVTDAAVYVGGHQRWMNNPWPSPSGDNDGPGSVARPGIAALDPLTGVPLSWNPGRDRGRGAEAIHPTDEYLLVGSDTDLWGGEVRQRLAALPVAGGTPNPQPVDVELPVTLYYTVGDRLMAAPFDGARLGTPSGVTQAPTGWSDLRDGFVQAGRLHYFGSGGNFWSRPFTGTGIGEPVNLSETVGYVDHDHARTPDDQPYGVAETTVATYHQGRIYYVKSGDPKLYQRGYSLESGIVEASEYVASSRSFAGARALDQIGDWLYAAWEDGRLYRFHAPGGRVDYSSRTLVDDGSRVDWRNVGGLWSRHVAGAAAAPTAPAPVTCSGSTPWKAEYWAGTALEGAPSTVRCEAEVSYTWGIFAPPGAEVPADGFSAAWTRTVTTTEPGSIRVSATTDDGVRAYVDGRRVVDSWIDTAAATRTGTSRALEPGRHTVRVEYYERSGAASADVDVDVVAPVAPPQEPDNLPGETTVTAPAAGASVPVGDLTIAGQATDDRAVGEVRVAVNNRDDATHRWLQPDGTWGPAYAYRTATLAAPGTGSTGWSLDVELPEGSYAVDARVFDEAGNEDQSPVWQPFTVGAADDTAPPTVAVASPSAHAELASSAVEVTGTAADDAAVDQVRVAVYDRGADSSARWLQGDGTWGATYAYRTATLGRAGTASTSWQLDLDLPDGAYALDVKAVDAGRRQSDGVWRPFVVRTVSADTVAPTAAVTGPEKHSVVRSTDVEAVGTAEDDRDVRAVRVAVYNRDLPDTPWLQADGSWGADHRYREATLARTGSGPGSARWSIGVPLDDGRYALDVRAQDAAGNVGPSVWWPFVVRDAVADTVAPTAAVTSPDKHAVVASSQVDAAGTAQDDRQVRGVRVAVYNRDRPETPWLQADGSWGVDYAYREATLTEAGATTTGWSLGVLLADGRYALDVRSEDAAGSFSPSVWWPFVVDAP